MKQADDEYADTMGRLRVTTNTADSFGLMLLDSPNGDWILASERDIKEARARILVDWDGDGEITAMEQDEKRKTDPGLILVKNNTTPVKLGFETLPLGSTFKLNLPADQNLVKVKINGVEKTGSQAGINVTDEVTVESANSGTGQAKITMECCGARDCLVIPVINDVNLSIVYDVVDEPATGTSYASGFGPNNCNKDDFVFKLNGNVISPSSVTPITNGFRFTFQTTAGALKNDNVFEVLNVLDWAGNEAEPYEHKFRLEDVLP